jgi:site-specific DNA-methyltransferase (adenine-specific)
MAAPRIYAQGQGWELWSGDSVEILNLLAPGSCHGLITDPPYSSGGFTRGDRALPARVKYCNNDSLEADLVPDFGGDNRDQLSFVAWSTIWLGKALWVCAPGSPGACFTDWRQLAAQATALQAGGWVFRGVGVWSKPSSRPQMGRFASACEYLVWGSAGPMRGGEDVGCLPGVVTCASVAGAEREHLTQKPDAVMRWAVSVVQPGGVVLDPFAGSGSTGVAALATGRRFIGIERSQEYCEVAARRLSEAERAAEGQLFGPRSVATQGGLFTGGR